MTIEIGTRVEVPAFWTSLPRRMVAGVYSGLHHTGNPMVKLDAGPEVVLPNKNWMKKLETDLKPEIATKDTENGEENKRTFGE